jgi:hypothetical protein
MSMSNQFKKWLKEICRWDRDDWFIHWKEEICSEGEEEYKGICYVYTRTNKYCIVAIRHLDGSTYLGCVVDSRTPRAGEDWTRGKDLPDGKFSRKTWNRIKDAIIGYELVRVSKSFRSVVDTSEEAHDAEQTVENGV